MEPKITPEMNTSLDSLPTAGEVRFALFQMHPMKAPGIDGMHALFFQRFWHIVGGDIIDFIQRWWRGDVDLQAVNHTVVVLIPKVKDPKNIREYRPISLCTILYKIASKTLANRLKPFLSALVGETQSAFVANRLITDNALLAFESFHYMKNKRHGSVGYFGLKLDMMKAYDRVE